MYEDIIFELINKPAGIELDQILKEGDNAVNRLDKRTAGAVIVLSDSKLAKRLKEAVATSEYRYRILLKEPHGRLLIDSLGEFCVSVKRLGAKGLRVVSQTRVEDQIKGAVADSKNAIKSLTLLEIAGVQIRELGSGNSRLITKKERNRLLDLLESIE
tara:strand:- start:13 stop:486 length:474 start_codon:yes stop_codon:yes gene_type:complete